MERALKVALKLQAYLAELPRSRETVFLAHYARCLEMKIERRRKRLWSLLSEAMRGEESLSMAAILSGYEALLPVSAERRDFLEGVCRSARMSIRRLKSRVQKRLSRLFAKEEDCGRRLCLGGVKTAVRGPFERLFFTKKVVDYLRGFLKRGRMKRSRSPAQTGDLEIAGAEQLLLNVHCLPCNRPISRNVLKYHLEGGPHRKRVAARKLCGDLDGNGCGGVGKVEGGVFSIENEGLLALAGELFSLFRGLRAICAESLAESGDKLLIDPVRLGMDATKSGGCTGGTKEVRAKREKKRTPYFCEICGAEIVGRSAFYSHFSAERHEEGLREFGVGKEDRDRFFGVTRREIVLKLFECVEEEEDEDGNVYDRKTYEDLVRHGLV